MSHSTMPSDGQQKKIEEVLPQVSRPIRIAFAAACAERVLPVAEDYFRGRREVLRKAIDLAWAYALGEKVEGAEIQETIDKLEQLVGKLFPQHSTQSTRPLSHSKIFHRILDGCSSFARGSVRD
jgi:hypothetical protein